LNISRTLLIWWNTFIVLSFLAKQGVVTENA
jgi:hypothetical protein